MGYYTNFDVQALSESPQAAEEAAHALVQQSKYSADMTGRSEFSIYEAKWYDWEKDVQVTSKLHPGVVFVIEGNGEESGDIWKAWAHNGEVHKSEATISFTEPDWLFRAHVAARDAAKEIHAAEQAKIEEAERAELARLQAKYGED